MGNLCDSPEKKREGVINDAQNEITRQESNADEAQRRLTKALDDESKLRARIKLQKKVSKQDTMSIMMNGRAKKDAERQLLRANQLIAECRTILHLIEATHDDTEFNKLRLRFSRAVRGSLPSTESVVKTAEAIEDDTEAIVEHSKAAQESRSIMQNASSSVAELDEEDEEIDIGAWLKEDDEEDVSLPVMEVTVAPPTKKAQKVTDRSFPAIPLSNLGTSTKNNGRGGKGQAPALVSEH